MAYICGLKNLVGAVGCLGGRWVSREGHLLHPEEVSEAKVLVLKGAGRDLVLPTIPRLGLAIALCQPWWELRPPTYTAVSALGRAGVS